MEILQGIAVSSGFAIAKAFLLNTEDAHIAQRYVQACEVDKQVERLLAGIRDTVAQLKDIQAQAASMLSDQYAAILDIPVLVLEDGRFMQDVTQLIKTEYLTAEHAVSRVFRRYIRPLEAMHDEFFSLRVVDLKDVERRLIRNILGKAYQDLSHLDAPVVLVSSNLTPSQTASLDKSLILGFATDIGGRTSHTAILARAIEIPAVVGLGNVTTAVSGGDMLVLDGVAGRVIVNPDPQTMQAYQARAAKFRNMAYRLSALRDLPSETLDGARIGLYANIEFPDEIPSALAHGAEGVGLYRTEFLYLHQDDCQPDEEEHFEAYKSAAEQLDGRPLVIRTLDLGGDKLASVIDGHHREKNPFLGYRSIRVCLERIALFKTQLRAILRASVYGDIRILFPMISSLEELLRAKTLLEEVRLDLRREGARFHREIPVGVMIEVPSAAVIADLLAREADFFSIGTNDLVQYCLAVDRGNARVAQLYQPAHLAILRLIRNVIKCARRDKTPVSLCGEMSGDALYMILLLGMGLRDFSLSSVAIPAIKKIIRSVDIAQCGEITRKVLQMAKVEETLDFLREETHKLLPDAFA